MRTEIRQIKHAKSLRYEIVYNGTVYARALALPLAEKIAEIVETTAAIAETIKTKLAKLEDNGA